VILLLAVAVGLLAGLARAWYGGCRLASPSLHLVWLVPVAFVPQWLAFHLPATRKLVPDDTAAAILVSSQAFLLVFAWLNRHQPGFWALGLGLALNLLAIGLNGGLMPISPETLSRLVPDALPDAWQIGHRLGSGKDVVLPIAATRLWWLGDRFLLPRWLPYQVAFSLGDAFIAGGAFWFLWMLGEGHGMRQNKQRRFEYAHRALARCKERFAKWQRVEPLSKRGGGKSGVLRSAVGRSSNGAENRLQR
jgi:hypothetical protein